MSYQTGDGRLLSFDVGEDERLVVGAVSENGRRRTIYQGMEPDEYALIPTNELKQELPELEIDTNELRVDDLSLVGRSVYIGPSDDRSVELQGDETIAEQGAPGVYGLLWIPLADR